VQQLVDVMIDRAAAEHPEVEFSVFVTEEDLAELPKHGDKLFRGGGYIIGHVYRDTMVNAMLDETAVDVDLVPLHDGTAAAAAAPMYSGDLMTGEVTVRPEQ
jgi:hypothetical protein